MLNIYSPSKNPFDKDASLALKGVAIILMMIHHNFRDVSLFSAYNISFWPFSEHQVVSFAFTCKICVSLFAFVSGYGLYLSYKRFDKSASKWVAHRYIKTFSGYWFVWIISAAICQIINGRTKAILFKDGLWNGIIYTIIDFLGLHNLFSTPSINGTWWYMSAAAVFILLLPVLYRFKDNIWLILIGTFAFIRVINRDNPFTGGNSIYAFLVPFILGFAFAENRILDKICKIGKSSPSIKAYKAAAEIWFIVLFYMMYTKLPQENFWEFHFGLFPMVIIIFCIEYIIPLHPVKRILIFLGKHSMNVFLVHTFIRFYYLHDFTYSWKHFILICLFLLVISIFISVILEFMKKIIGYSGMINKLCFLLKLN